MKILQSSLVRAVMAFVVGALIIKFREETVHWLTIVIGALFFVTGLISVVLNRKERPTPKRPTPRRPTPQPLPAREGSDYSQGDGLQAEKHSTPLPHREGQGGGSAAGGSASGGGSAALASLVGFGSIILGVILALMPTTFITGLQYVMAAMLVLGAVNQFVNLAQASRWCHVGWFYWLLPVVVLLVAIFMIWRPIETAAAPLFIIGWCMLLYGMAELLGGLMVWKADRIVRRMEREAEQARQEQIAQQAETTEYIEVKE